MAGMEDETVPPPCADAGKPALADPERWVDEYGDCLFRFALMRLRDPTRAEDAVQETFLAALKGGSKFAGRSAEKSWLIGILRNKICDYFRKTSREVSFTDLEFYSEEDAGGTTSAFMAGGKWKNDAVPQEWTSAGDSLDVDLFWKTFRSCLEKLPEKVSTAFQLRAVDGFESKEVSALLNISENNLWVMLHRARLGLRRCLENHWFAKKM
jgi:RNA polymerase sigma-70 factor, ECF subfamily